MLEEYKEWIEAGFEYCPEDPVLFIYPDAECLLHKKIETSINGIDKLNYSIEVYPSYYWETNTTQYIMRLVLQKQDNNFDVTLYNVRSPEHAIEFAESVWSKLECDFS